MKLKASSLKRFKKKKKTFRQIHQEKEKAQINKTRNEKEVTMNTTEISTTSNYMPIKWKI